MKQQEEIIAKHRQELEELKEKHHREIESVRDELEVCYLSLLLLLLLLLLLSLLLLFICMIHLALTLYLISQIKLAQSHEGALVIKKVRARSRARFND